MKRKIGWLLLIVGGLLLLPFLYFIWPGVFAFTIIAVLIVLNVKLPVIKGLYGEWQVIRLLDKLGEEYRIFNDLYVPKENGELTQVDHVVTSPYGIFIIETKHYAGWIFGNEHQPQWTQVIYKRKEKLYNPIRQNYGHLMSLKAYLGSEEKQNFHSVIAFSPQSTFKFKEPFQSAAVIHFPELLQTIKEKRDVVIDRQELAAINEQMGRLMILDKKVKKEMKKQHLSTVRSKETNKVKPKSTLEKRTVGAAAPSGKKESQPEKKTMANGKAETVFACAECGNEMKLKKGRYGTFYGCSNYPVCRYTKKVSISS